MVGALPRAGEPLRCGPSPLSPPISWSDGQQVRGLAPELVKRLFGALGYRVEVVLGNWRRCLLDAAAGRVDLILAYRTPARDRDLAFSAEPVLREDVPSLSNRQPPLRRAWAPQSLQRPTSFPKFCRPPETHATAPGPATTRAHAAPGTPPDNSPARLPA
ncbi:substrate-binding periplasmic protein, partial [Pseudomonas aeruginosa]|uniref:substrate-binding periplasmic protein n=1 Tax=Pseudomonas aeruginosa TaxID=287 RepID=UPI00359414D8